MPVFYGVRIFIVETGGKMKKRFQGIFIYLAMMLVLPLGLFIPMPVLRLPKKSSTAAP